MFLIISTASDEEVKVILVGSEDDFKIKKVKARFKQSEKLLTMVEGILKASKVRLGDLKGIGVVSGPGGFTSLRIGVVTANTLAYGLNIPVVGIKAGEFSSDKELVGAIIKTLKHQNTRKSVVVPEYDREPNITISKNLKK